MDEKNSANKLALRSGSRSPEPISPLQLYLKEIAKYPLLDPEEELELAKRHYEQNDVQAAHRLITSNLRLVVKIANDFRRAQANFLDLIQEGTYGLMQGVKKFNPYKGVKLSSYAAWWIRAYILKYLMDNKSQVKLATTAAQRKLFYNLQKETQKLLSEYERADPKKIALSLNVSEKDVIEMQKRLSASDVSLDAPLLSEPDGARRGDLIADEREDAETFLLDQQVKAVFAQYLDEFKSKLKGRDLEVLEKRLLSEKPLTLQELGDMYGVTRERARQIEANLIAKLRKFVEEKGTLIV